MYFYTTYIIRWNVLHNKVKRTALNNIGNDAEYHVNNLTYVNHAESVPTKELQWMKAFAMKISKK